MTAEMQRFMKLVEASEGEFDGIGAYALIFGLKAFASEMCKAADAGEFSPATALLYCPKAGAMLFKILKESGGLSDG